MPKRTLNERQSAWVGQRDAYIREMKLNLVSSKQKLTAVEDQTRFGVRKQYLALDTAKRSIALYKKSLLPQAQQALNAARTAYISGKMDFIGFVDAQRTLLNVQLGEQKALRDYRIALAELERLVGRALKKGTLKLPATPRKDSK
jgi:cobalt-zinc-cadmium efflux system outer membrane protein